jgi:excisionase family DNA binding protein
MSKSSYRIDEAAEELGVSPRTVERAIKAGEIQSFKFRDTRRIDCEEIQRVKKKEQNESN